MRPLRLLALALLLGCGGPPAEAPFIALQRDFRGFEGWERFHLEADGTGSVHTGVERDIYLRSRPSGGSTTFPVGTLIVRRINGAGTAEGPHTFAMAKRGGGYNEDGALGWEWFELVQNEPGGPWVIAWRGIGPPAGEEYGPDGQACNGCHMEARTNDYVKAEALRLSTLAR